LEEEAIRALPPASADQTLSERGGSAKLTGIDANPVTPP
jgi:hypothetical protein